MASIRLSPSVERLIINALQKLPVSQAREHFIVDAGFRYVDDLKRNQYRIK